MAKLKINKILFIIILIIVGVNSILLINLTYSLNKNLSDSIEAGRPANLQATIIKPNDCENCFDIDAAFENIKKTNVKIEKEKTLLNDDENAQELIAKYNITKLPTIIFTGEIKKDENIEKAWEAIGEMNSDAVIFTNLTPPYFDVVEGRTFGNIEIIYINDESCEDCVNHSNYVAQLKKAGVIIKSETTYDYRDEKAQKLIESYGITKIPTFIANKELSAYQKIVTDWNKIGKVGEDGAYFATQIAAPYRDLEENKVNGLITATLLLDKNCEDCTSKEDLQKFLDQLRLKFDKQIELDVSGSQAKALISKYSIEKVPTLILDDQGSFYPYLNGSWKQVGTIEEDGTFVLRNTEIFN